MTLDEFIAEARRAHDRGLAPCDCVEALVPAMHRLVSGDLAFLTAAHCRPDPDRYARNAIYIAPGRELSLFALVWNPGQWTPIHDHGAWGVVGVVEGALEERSYVRTDRAEADGPIVLARGGVFLMTERSISSFVPNPDHIHITGVSADRPRVVSLHLYGRHMNRFHVYDADAGTRRLVDVPYNES